MIQRAVEKSGISSVGISIVRTLSERVRPPRTVFVDWPFGHPLGRPFQPGEQRHVLMAALQALQEITQPGTIVDLRLPWSGTGRRSRGSL